MNKLKSYAASRTRGRDTLLSFGIVIAAFIIVQALIAGGMISSQIKGLLVPICAYVVMAISLNLTVGILGELSLGHAGFMSVGAFAGIVTTTCLADAIPLAPLRLAVAMIVGGRFAALARRYRRRAGAPPQGRLPRHRYPRLRRDHQEYRQRHVPRKGCGRPAFQPGRARIFSSATAAR